MEIISGVIQKAKKVVIYGPEGIGKSTFAAQFPSPLFIDTEGSTNGMNVKRLPKPTTWSYLLQEIDHVKHTPGLCKTLVIDTVDWAERLEIEATCAKYGKKGIEDFGYGNGYVYSAEEIGRFLNSLSDLIEIGINVVLTAHAQLRKFEQPDEMGAYDRWELKLGKKTSSQTSPLIKEWADMVLFVNYKTVSVAVDNKGKKHKAQGGKRVMYTTHHPCWDAKNRDNLPEEMEFNYQRIAHLFEKKETQPSTDQNIIDTMNTSQISAEQTEIKNTGTCAIDFTVAEYQTLPDELVQLMKESCISEAKVREAVSKRGICPIDMPLGNYPMEFFKQELIPNWHLWVKFIDEMNMEF